MKAENPDITQSSHHLRYQIASWRDELIKRQKRNYSKGRQQLIDRLGKEYRRVYQLALDTEVE